MLKSLVNFSLDTSLSFLFLRAVPSNDPLSFCEVGSDGLWEQKTSVLVRVHVSEPTDLYGEVLKRSSFNRVDREFVVGVNSSEASRNLI